jgi:hypothetical protein
MNNRALLSAVALCFLVAGCQPKKEEPAQPKVADKVVPLPAAAPTPPPASADQDAKNAPVAQVADAKPGVAPSPKGGPLGCTRGRCKVSLDVTGAGDPNCTIAKNPDPLYVWAQNQGDTIVFTVRTNGWSFDANGISFATGNFTCSPGGNPQTYNCVNPNQAKGTHNYKVKLKTSDGKKCTKDPSVVNGVDDPDATPAGAGSNG